MSMNPDWVKLYRLETEGASLFLLSPSFVVFKKGVGGGGGGGRGGDVDRETKTADWPVFVLLFLSPLSPPPPHITLAVCDIYGNKCTCKYLSQS